MKTLHVISILLLNCREKIFETDFLGRLNTVNRFDQVLLIGPLPVVL